MAYNPGIHHRKSIRLKEYDYSQAGFYFITICIQDKKCLFGNISSSGMLLNDFGIVAYNQWQKLPERYANITLDVFQIMPNHIHGIIIINEPVGAGLAPAHGGNAAGNGEFAGGATRAGASPAPTIGNIVGAYKSLVAKQCLEIFKQKHPAEMMGKLWQRDYYEHIIPDERSHRQIAGYIINNPQNWKEDGF
jgi:putative transposase